MNIVMNDDSLLNEYGKMEKRNTGLSKKPEGKGGNDNREHKSTTTKTWRDKTQRKVKENT